MAREQNRPHLGPEETMSGCKGKRIELNKRPPQQECPVLALLRRGMLAGCPCRRRRLIILSEFDRTVQSGVARQDLCLFEVVCPSGKQLPD